MDSVSSLSSGAPSNTFGPMLRTPSFISQCVQDAYANFVPSRGKPQVHEWTMLAGIVSVSSSTDGNADTIVSSSSSSSSSGTSTTSLSSSSGSSHTIVTDPSSSTVPTLPSSPSSLPSSMDCIIVTTGNKCIGQRYMQRNGSVITDCHAEILAIRLLKYRLLQEIQYHIHTCLKDKLGLYLEKAVELVKDATGKVRSPTDLTDTLLTIPCSYDFPSSSLYGSSSSTTDDEKPQSPLLLQHSVPLLWLVSLLKTNYHQPSSPPDTQSVTSILPLFHLRNNLSLHLYISDSPCGHATMYDDQPETTREATPSIDNASVHLSSSAEKNTDSTDARDDNSLPTPSSFTSSRRTGAKPIDSSLDVSSFSSSSTLRTKPGRSDLPPSARTLSMSCSDKLMRYLSLGIQGSLLYHFLLHPIYLSTVTVSNETNNAYLSSRQPSKRFRTEYPHNAGQYSTNEAMEWLPQYQALTEALLKRAHVANENILQYLSVENNGPLSYPYYTLPPVPQLFVDIAGERFQQGRAETTLRKAGSTVVSSSSFSSSSSAIVWQAEPSSSSSFSYSESPTHIDLRKSSHNSSDSSIKHLVGGTGSGADIVPSNTSINAYRSIPSFMTNTTTTKTKTKNSSVYFDTEVITGSLGILQGRNKTAPPDQLASRLSKYKMGKEFQAIWRMYTELWTTKTLPTAAHDHSTYYAAKHCSFYHLRTHQMVKQWFHRPEYGLGGWLFGSQDYEEFTLTDSVNTVNENSNSAKKEDE